MEMTQSGKVAPLVELMASVTFGSKLGQNGLTAVAELNGMACFDDSRWPRLCTRI